MNSYATREQLLALFKPCDASLYTISEYERKLIKPIKEKSQKTESKNNLLF